MVRWNGAARTTTFVSATELRASIPASDLAVHGPASVTVVNASPGGGTSSAATVTVRPTDPCQYLPPYATTSTLNGSLDANDCRFSDGSYADLFQFTLASAQALTFHMNSTNVDSYLIVRDASGNTLGFDDDGGSGLNSWLSILLNAGTYRLVANTPGAADFGGYQLTSEVGPSAVTSCNEVWITRGILVNQSVADYDCSRTEISGTYYADQYRIYLAAGATVTLTMNATEVDAYLLVRNTLDVVLAEDDDSAGGSNARLVFTAPSAGTYVIEASTYDALDTGNYSLTVQ